MADSQDKVKRVRRPRVHISYEVEEDGAMKLKDLPFVVGVISDLGGHKKDLRKLTNEKRQFLEIDRDNFNARMAEIAPTLNLRVKDVISGNDQEMAVNLNFRSMDDFDPGRIAEQVPALKALLETRHKLKEALARMDMNPELEELLKNIMANPQQVEALAKQLGEATQGGNQ